MAILIIIIIAGTFITYASLQNTTPVAISFAGYTVSDVPLFYIALGSVLFGLILAYTSYLLRALSWETAVHTKDAAIKNMFAKISELEKTVQNLELQNQLLVTQIKQATTPKPQT